MITYKEVMDRGFKRLDLGGDRVFQEENGYDWFLCEKVIQKLSVGKLKANWFPDTKTIDVMKIVKGEVISKKTITDIDDFDEIDELFNPSPQNWVA